MLFGDKNKSVTIHQNLLAHNNQRNPRLNPEVKGRFQVNNNVIYNWGQIAGEMTDDAEINLTGNFYKSGPSSRPERGVAVDGKVKIYPKDNISPIRPNATQPEDAIIKLGKGNRYNFNYDACTGCAVCYEQCPCHAIEMIPEPVKSI